MVAELGTLVPVVVHTLIIYLFLVLSLSFLGRREMSQLTFAELTVLLVLGSSVETAMVAGNLTLLAGLTSAGTLFLSNRGFTLLVQRSPELRRLVIGAPIILVHDGRLVTKNLQAVSLTEADVLEAIRERGYASPGELRFVVLEVDGSIGAVPREAVIHRHRRQARPLQPPTGRGQPCR